MFGLRDAKIRLRGSEIVPYISQALLVREPDAIYEIVTGPAASLDAPRTVGTMIKAFGLKPTFPIEPSDIPYRAL